MRPIIVVGIPSDLELTALPSGLDVGGFGTHRVPPMVLPGTGFEHYRESVEQAVLLSPIRIFRLWCWCFTGTYDYGTRATTGLFLISSKRIAEADRVILRIGVKDGSHPPSRLGLRKAEASGNFIGGFIVSVPAGNYALDSSFSQTGILVRVGRCSGDCCIAEWFVCVLRERVATAIRERRVCCPAHPQGSWPVHSSPSAENIHQCRQVMQVGGRSRAGEFLNRISAVVQVICRAQDCGLGHATAKGIVLKTRTPEFIETRWLRASHGCSCSFRHSGCCRSHHISA